MREEYAHGAPPADATVRGFGHGAKIVTAAALIMIAVFGSFVLADMQVIKGTRFALCISVLSDAFVDRMALVPAVMTIFGNRAWWLPRFLPPHRTEDDSPARCGGSRGQAVRR
jgi:RND superfamily putative drug exporter